MTATPFFPDDATSTSLSATRCFKSPLEGCTYFLYAAPLSFSTRFASFNTHFCLSSSSASIHPASAAGSSAAITPSIFSRNPACMSIAIAGVFIPESSMAACMSSPIIMDTHVPTTAILFGENSDSAYLKTSSRMFCPPNMNSLSASEVVSTRRPSSSRSLACLNEHPDGPCSMARSTPRSLTV